MAEGRGGVLFAGALLAIGVVAAKALAARADRPLIVPEPTKPPPAGKTFVPIDPGSRYRFQGRDSDMSAADRKALGEVYRKKLEGAGHKVEEPMTFKGDKWTAVVLFGPGGVKGGGMIVPNRTDVGLFDWIEVTEIEAA